MAIAETNEAILRGIKTGFRVDIIEKFIQYPKIIR